MPRLSSLCRLVWRTNPRKRKFGRNRIGQATVEYILMIAFGAVLSLEIVKFFNDIMREGLIGLERNIQTEVQTGQGFGGGR